MKIRINKDAYEPSRSTKIWIPGNKVKNFVILFEFIANQTGGLLKAIKYIGTSKNVVYRMKNSNELTQESAIKIMCAYKKAKSSINEKIPK